MQRFGRVGLWLAALVLTGGCACCCGVPIGPSPDLDDRDLVGEWVSDKGPRIVLNADRTFSAENLRACARDDDTVEDIPEGGSGSWILHGPETLDPYQRLELRFSPTDIPGWDWLAGDDEILFPIGDPDAGHACFFERA